MTARTVGQQKFANAVSTTGTILSVSDIKYIWDTLCSKSGLDPHDLTLDLVILRIQLPL